MLVEHSLANRGELEPTSDTSRRDFRDRRHCFWCIHQRATSDGSFTMTSTEAYSAVVTSSVQTLKLTSVLGPNVVAMATSIASRPLAISTRPIRGTLFRASKVYQRPPRYASNQAAKSIGP